MAEQAAHHVVNSTQSVGALPPADVSDNNQLPIATGGEASDGRSQEPARSENIHKEEVPPTAGASLSIPLQTSDKPDATLPNGTHTMESGAAGTESDPDWRRGDSADTLARPPSRERSNSFKKPTAFKTVSVTKNFLAKSVGTSPSPKLSLSMDKGVSASPAASPAASLAKPRLVAKSGSTSRAATLTNSGSSGAPDPSKVWNRNRPVAPAPPKQFTDEELKQQYGIHLATRLQAGEPDKGSKWADMEDDEDDWAPDTVEWMDGTKSTLQPSDEQKEQTSGEQTDLTAPQPPPTQPAEALAQPEKPSADNVPRENTSGIGGLGKTILRPGARSSISSTKPGLILRSVPEPSSETPKQTTPGPSKSPWAKLPPVDKISPIAFNPATQADGRPPPVSYREYDTPPPSGPSPAREIAADTFERSWREGDRGASRELFDSKSGRYEPVRDKRRSSFRQDGNFRPPSVLQRPSQSYGRPSDSSEAPSARAMMSNDARQWERRRSSVAVEEDGSESRKALSTSPHSAKASISDQGQGPSSARAYSAHGPEGASNQGQQQPQGGENVHEMQHQLMRQRIEANRRRKEEEQVKEEAERKERIRQKLIALGPEPPKKQAEKESPEKQPTQIIASNAQVPSSESQKPEVTKPTTEADRNGLQAAHPLRLEPAAHLDGLGEVPASLAMPKKPSSIAAPETASKRQTGLDSFSTQHLTSKQMSASPSQTGGSLKPTSSDSAVPALEQSAHNMSAQPNMLSDSQRNFKRQQQAGAHQPPHWGRANGGMAGAPTWTAESSAGGPGKVSANVWGPLSKDKSLGNGAFDTDMARIPSIGFPSQAPSHPGPIAPPSASPKVNMPSSRSEPSPPGITGANRPDWKGPGQPPGFPQRGAFAPSDSHNQRPPPGFLGPGHSQGPIGPQWQAFGNRDRDAIGDRWVGGDRSRPVHGTPGPESLTPAMTPPRLGQGPPSQHGAPSMAPGGPVSSVARTGSRFFGAGADRQVSGSVPAPGQAVIDGTAAAQTADMDSSLFREEVIGTDGRHSAVVRLPMPKPKVKLPSTPTPTRSSELSRSGAPMSSLAGRPSGLPGSPTTTGGGLLRSQPVRFGQQPIVAQAEWQNRFDMVTGRKATAAPATATFVGPAQLARGNPSTPGRVMGVNMSTRPAIELDAKASSATVSLPQTMRPKDPALYSLPATRAQTTPGENELWDEPETGSKPTVFLPRMLPSLAWGSAMLAGQHKPAVQVRPQLIQAMAKVAYSFDLSSRIDIHIPNHLERKTHKYLTRKPTPMLGRGSKNGRRPAQKKERPFEKKGAFKNQAPAAVNGVGSRDEHDKTSTRPSKKSSENNGTGEASAPKGEKRGGWTRPMRGSKGPPVGRTAVP